MKNFLRAWLTLPTEAQVIRALEKGVRKMIRDHQEDYQRQELEHCLNRAINDLKIGDQLQDIMHNELTTIAVKAASKATAKPSPQLKELRSYIHSPEFIQNLIAEINQLQLKAPHHD